MDDSLPAAGSGNKEHRHREDDRFLCAGYGGSRHQSEVQFHLTLNGISISHAGFPPRSAGRKIRDQVL